MHNILKILLKFIFSFGLIFWLIKRGHLDFSMIKSSLATGYAPFICLFLIFLQALLASYRWKLFIEIRTKTKLSFLKIIQLNWIGLFFSTLLPGAVTGDFIKIIYAKKLHPSLNKTFLLTSALIDRITGLIGLLFLLGITSIFQYQNLINLYPSLKPILIFNFFLLIGALSFFVALFLPKKFRHFIKSINFKIPIIGNRLNETFEHFWDIGDQKQIILTTLILSILAQILAVLAFWQLTAPFYTNEIPLKFLFTFVPIGFIAVAIPIAPAGLGVGHVMFQKLFSFIGIANGASLFNLFFLCCVILNLLGSIPYLLISGKKEVSTL